MCSVGEGDHLNALYQLSNMLKILSTSERRGSIQLFFIFTYTHKDTPTCTHMHVSPHGAGRDSINLGGAEGVAIGVAEGV